MTIIETNNEVKACDLCHHNGILNLNIFMMDGWYFCQACLSQVQTRYR